MKPTPTKLTTKLEDPPQNCLNGILHRKAELNLYGEEEYSRVKSFEIMEEASRNSAVAPAFLGLGVGARLSGDFAHESRQEETTKCSHCGKEAKKSDRFCASCGGKIE